MVAAVTPANFVAARTSAGGATQSKALGGKQRLAKQVRHDVKMVALCPFHLKWGDWARKCQPSCSRWDPGKATQQVFQVEEILPQEEPASEN